jgi:hypothetical protein
MNRAITRRTALKRLAQGGVGLVLLKNGLSARAYAANEKLNLAHVGCGGRGKELVDGFAKMENLVTLCDVNQSKAAAVYKEYPNVPKYDDFRKMLDEMAKQIDAVVVATPDHTHAIASVTAMKAGKHVYCEKPLTGCVYEARAMRQTAEKQKVATQMGNQGSSSGQFRRGVELIQDGVLGEVREVYGFKDSGGADHKEVPKETPPVPDYLKWDLWLGPIRERAFHPRWLGWSAWRDFGTGEIGMWGSHSNYVAFTALKVGSLWQAEAEAQPRMKVQAEVSGINRLSFPRWEAVHFQIPARGDLPPVTFHWINGSGAPGGRKKIEDAMGKQLDWGDAGEKKWADHAGALIVGSRGKMHLTGHNATFELLPEDGFKDVETKNPKRLPGSQGHERDWLLACRGGKPPLSSFSLTGPYMEMLLLVNVATQFKDELEYDPLEGKIVNRAEANAALRREYREGWSL